LRRTSRIVAVVTIALAPSAARGEPPAVGPTAAVLAGYGLEPDTVVAGGDVDAYRIGLGARVGTTLPMHVYLGGTFVVHFGSETSASGEGGAQYDARYHVTYWGVEGGYDFGVYHVLLRPYAGTGVLASVGHTTVRGGSTGKHDAFFYVAPGFLAAYRVDAWFVGIDLRMPLPFAEEAIRWAPAIFLTAGTHL
jgi:hypothetical protein